MKPRVIRKFLNKRGGKAKRCFKKRAKTMVKASLKPGRERKALVMREDKVM